MCLVAKWVFLFSKPLLYNVIIIQNPFILVNIVPYHPKKNLFFIFCKILVVAHFLVVDVLIIQEIPLTMLTY